MRSLQVKTRKARGQMHMGLEVARTAASGGPVASVAPIPRSGSVDGFSLTPDQDKALGEILAAFDHGSRYLLTGFAGSGKTTLVQHLAREILAQKRSIALTAPTHKAVAVLSSKLREVGIEGVECRTIHSLLCLRPKPHGDILEFVRDKRATPVKHDLVVVDECSMLDSSLMTHIRRHLPTSFTLFVGDPAQLPPVGEEASRSFDTKARSHLDTIVRQSADNPVLAAAHAIRQSQGGPMDWSWCKPAKAPPLGVYLPGPAADQWIKKGFTSQEFEDNPDSFRYLAWTNARVASINRKVRRWRYGDHIPTPFMPGERALLRGPVIIEDVALFNTNEEAKVEEIGRDVFPYPLESCQGVSSWVAEIPTWRVRLRRDGEEHGIDVHMVADEQAYARAEARIIDEAGDAKKRWQHLHDFRVAFAKLQSIYALTIHCAQGSTFGRVFVDIPDIRRRMDDNLLETQQLLYVAATRPTKALVLVGI